MLNSKYLKEEKYMHYKEYKSILSPKNGMNLYRGCSHGCIYCDSRSKCYQMDHDFEDIEIKKNAPQMLEAELRHRRKKCMIGTGAMTDPYLHLEKNLEYTRKSLEIVEKYGFGLSIQTKSNLILRDLDLLSAINQKSKCVVQITMTTYNDDLCQILEPNVSTTKERFEVLKIMRDNHIPTIVWLSPFLPFINDTEENFCSLLDYCKEAKVFGILCFGIGLTLRDGNREYFYHKLDIHFPGMKKKYIDRYGNSYECTSDNHKALMKLLQEQCRKYNIICNINELFTYMHTYENKQEGIQLNLF